MERDEVLRRIQDKKPNALDDSRIYCLYCCNDCEDDSRTPVL